jgi:hypothetical protein
MAHSMKPATCRPLSFRRNLKFLYGSNCVLLIRAAAVLLRNYSIFRRGPSLAFVLKRLATRPAIRVTELVHGSWLMVKRCEAKRPMVCWLHRLAASRSGRPRLAGNRPLDRNAVSS